MQPILTRAETLRGKSLKHKFVKKTNNFTHNSILLLIFSDFTTVSSDNLNTQLVETSNKFPRYLFPSKDYYQQHGTTHKQAIKSEFVKYC